MLFIKICILISFLYLLASRSSSNKAESIGGFIINFIAGCFGSFSSETENPPHHELISGDTQAYKVMDGVYKKED